MTMTKEEAIKTLRELWRETNDSWYEEAYNMAIEALSKPYWIPISEGLPNEQESVNVTVVDDHGDNEWRYTTTAWRINDIWISDNDLVMGTVVAWAPLPKPYERDKL